MSQREDAMRDFLAREGWGGASVTPLPGDASTRRYARLAEGSRRALLMDQPQGAETPAAPPDADEKTRRALGYNAVARLAGADVARFAAVARHLKDAGLSAPEIHAFDPRQGFMVIEDLGDGLFADVVTQGADETALYMNAMEVLATLHADTAPATLPGGAPLFAYDEIALLAEVDLLTEWYFPFALGRAATAAEVAGHRALWQAALAPVLAQPPVLVHRDYHAQNLLWLPQRAGAMKTGLIDFQDAVAGSPAYDLVSLLEDARRDVAPELAQAATIHYLAITGADKDAFRAAMAVMAAQRNAKIVGIFARLYKRDGKPRYLSYLPRVWGHLERDLAHPSLAALRAWYDRTISARPAICGDKGNSVSVPVRHAMIMAAGLGTRMRPLTDDRPKPLVLVAGKTLIDHNLDRLVAAGVELAVVNLHYKAEMLRAHLAKRSDIEIRYSDESGELLGTGGGIVKALPLLGNEPFFVLNSDSIWVEGYIPALTRMMQLWDPARMDGLLLMAAMVTAMGYDGRGDFVMDAEGHVERPGEHKSTPFAYPGVQIVHPRLFEKAPQGEFSTNILWDRAIAARRLFGMRLEGMWLHVGTPEARDEAEAVLAKLPQ